MPLGAFASGLFGGIISTLEIGARVEMLKQQRMWNEVAEKTAAAMQSDGSTTGSNQLPAVKEMPGAPIDLTAGLGTTQPASATSLADDPDLKSMPTPKYMEALPTRKPSKTLPASVQNAFDATAGMKDSPKLLPPASGPAMAFDTTAGMEGTPGALTWSSARGIHRTNPVEDMIGGAQPAPEPAGALSWSSSRGIHRAEPKTAAPVSQEAPTYLPPEQTALPRRRLEGVAPEGRRLDSMRGVKSRAREEEK